MLPDAELHHIRQLFSQALLALSKATLRCQKEFLLEGLLGITLDKAEVIIININETVKVNPAGVVRAAKPTVSEATVAKKDSPLTAAKPCMKRQLSAPPAAVTDISNPLVPKQPCQTTPPTKQPCQTTPPSKQPCQTTPPSKQPYQTTPPSKPPSAKKRKKTDKLPSVSKNNTISPPRYDAVYCGASPSKKAKPRPRKSSKTADGKTSTPAGVTKGAPIGPPSSSVPTSVGFSKNVNAVSPSPAVNCGAKAIVSSGAVVSSGAIVSSSVKAIVSNGVVVSSSAKTTVSSGVVVSSAAKATVSNGVVVSSGALLSSTAKAKVSNGAVVSSTAKALASRGIYGGASGAGVKTIRSPSWMSGGSMRAGVNNAATPATYVSIAPKTTPSVPVQPIMTSALLTMNMNDILTAVRNAPVLSSVVANAKGILPIVIEPTPVTPVSIPAQSSSAVAVLPDDPASVLSGAQCWEFIPQPDAALDGDIEIKTEVEDGEVVANGDDSNKMSAVLDDSKTLADVTDVETAMVLRATDVTDDLVVNIPSSTSVTVATSAVTMPTPVEVPATPVTMPTSVEVPATPVTVSTPVEVPATPVTMPIKPDTVSTLSPANTALDLTSTSQAAPPSPAIIPIEPVTTSDASIEISGIKQPPTNTKPTTKVLQDYLEDRRRKSETEAKFRKVTNIPKLYDPEEGSGLFHLAEGLSVSRRAFWRASTSASVKRSDKAGGFLLYKAIPLVFDLEVLAKSSATSLDEKRINMLYSYVNGWCEARCLPLLTPSTGHLQVVQAVQDARKKYRRQLQMRNQKASGKLVNTPLSGDSSSTSAIIAEKLGLDDAPDKSEETLNAAHEILKQGQGSSWRVKRETSSSENSTDKESASELRHILNKPAISDKQDGDNKLAKPTDPIKSPQSVPTPPPPQISPSRPVENNSLDDIPDEPPVLEIKTEPVDDPESIPAHPPNLLQKFHLVQDPSENSCKQEFPLELSKNPCKFREIQKPGEARKMPMKLGEIIFFNTDDNQRTISNNK